MVTDYDCWRHNEGVEDVSVSTVVEILGKNVSLARKILENVVVQIPKDPDPDCVDALEHAIMTAPAAITSQVRQRLDLIIGEYIRT